jgi:hypothetical protein
MKKLLVITAAIEAETGVGFWPAIGLHCAGGLVRRRSQSPRPFIKQCLTQ